MMNDDELIDLNFNTPSGCPDLEDLAAFAEGIPLLGFNSIEWNKDRLISHLVDCDRCLSIVAFVIKSKEVVPDPEIKPPKRHNLYLVK